MKSSYSEVQHLFVDFLHRHPATEHCSDCQVPSMSGVASCHHVLSIEHLLCELRDGERSVLLAATGCQGGEAGHEEVETGEGDHVDSQFPQISVKLTRETQAGGNAGHGGRDQMVQVTVCGGGELQGTEADIVQGLVINAVGLVCVLDQLMH